MYTSVVWVYECRELCTPGVSGVCECRELYTPGLSDVCECRELCRPTPGLSGCISAGSSVHQCCLVCVRAGSCVHQCCLDV